MAVFDGYEGMDDVKLKPRILHSIISDHLPSNEDDPLPDYIDVHRIVSAIKTFGLLFESFPQEANSKLVEDWTVSIDAWVHRLLSLVSSPRAKKCWLGICLLGVTCQECSSNRFLESYSLWLHKFLSNIQPASEYISVRVAACASISDLLIRLSRFASVKKDGISHAGRVVQPVLELLNEDNSEAVLEGAVDLLCTVVNFFPASVQHYYSSVEAIIVSKIISARCSFRTLEKFAHCLALLPKSKGDEESWFLMMQELLTSISIYLNDAFQGLETGDATRPSVPPVQNQLGGWTMTEEGSYLEAKSSKQFLASIIPTLMLCCSTMLTNPYPVQVTVPVQQLLELVRRVLTMNGSLSQIASPFTMIMQQEVICSELPVLHSYCLDLLDSIIKGARSQFLPYASHIIRLLKEYLGRCRLPALRIKVYSVIRTLLMSMGVGIALYISEDVIRNAFIDLDFASRKQSFGAEYNCSTVKSLLPPGYKKRRLIIEDCFGEQQGGQCAQLSAHMKNSASPTSLKIAALEALEILLTVGSGLKSENLRANVDLLLISVAKRIYDGKWACEEVSGFLPSSEPTLAELQLAALRALLASLLSQIHACPHFLSQGLELFHKGKQEKGTKLAEFCAHALLALEVVMHPRIISPVAPISSTNKGLSNDELKSAKSGNKYLNGPENNAQNSTSMGMETLNPDDDPCDSWLGSGYEIEATASNPNEAVRSNKADHLPISGTEIYANTIESQASEGNMEIGRNGDDTLHKTKHFPGSTSVGDVKAFTGSYIGSPADPNNNILNYSESSLARIEVNPWKDVFAVTDDDRKSRKGGF